MQNPGSDRIRVLIADDHALYRRGLLTMLDTEDGIEVIGEAADGVEAVVRAEELLPDVVVLDVSMPKRGGIDACRGIKASVPATRILMLTSSEDETHLFEAVRAGANGYLLKDASPEKVAEAIRGVHNGQSLLSPMMAAKLLTEFAALSSPRPVPRGGAGSGPELDMPRLTERELDILRLVARGRLNREIAAELFISENTVRNHIRNILDKLQLHSRTEAALYAVRQRLIDPDE